MGPAAPPHCPSRTLAEWVPWRRCRSTARGTRFSCFALVLLSRWRWRTMCPSRGLSPCSQWWQSPQPRRARAWCCTRWPCTFPCVVCQYLSARAWPTTPTRPHTTWMCPAQCTRVECRCTAASRRNPCSQRCTLCACCCPHAQSPTLVDRCDKRLSCNLCLCPPP